LCNIDNLLAVALSGQRDNLLGLDSILTGAFIAFSMEYFEKGILTEADPGGRVIHLDDADAMLWQIEEITEQCEISKILSMVSKGLRY